MERGCDEGSFLETHGVYRMGVEGGTQAHIPALRTRGSRAAESEGGTKLPPHLPKAESRLGSQGLQGRPAVSHAGSKRASKLRGRSQDKPGTWDGRAPLLLSSRQWRDPPGRLEPLIS